METARRYEDLGLEGYRRSDDDAGAGLPKARAGS